MSKQRSAMAMDVKRRPSGARLHFGSGAYRWGADVGG